MSRHGPVSSRVALAAAVLWLVGMGGAPVRAQSSAPPRVVPSISLASTELIPAAPVDGSASFSVPALAPADFSTVQVAVEVRNDPNHNLVHPIEEPFGTGLTGCTPRAGVTVAADEPPVMDDSSSLRAFVCVVEDITVPGEYSLPFQLVAQDRVGSEYPVTAQVAATWSYATAANPEAFLLGGEAIETVVVSAPAQIEPPSGFAVSASCVDDGMTVVIEADDPDVTFWANFSEGPIPPQTWTFPRGEGETGGLIVVGDPGDPFTVLRQVWFAETVDCASGTPDTTTPDTTLPPLPTGQLPATGPLPISVPIALAWAASATGSLLLLLRRTL